MSPMSWIVIVPVGLLFVWGLLAGWRRVRSRLLGREPAVTQTGRVCPCGYTLQGIAMPRCPECGRAIGFDKTFEEMGIDVGAVERHVSGKRGTKES